MEGYFSKSLIFSTLCIDLTYKILSYKRVRIVSFPFFPIGDYYDSKWTFTFFILTGQPFDSACISFIESNTLILRLALPLFANKPVLGISGN